MGLHMALRALGEFNFIGVTEHFQESMELLKYKLGLPIPKVYEYKEKPVSEMTNVHKHTKEEACHDARAERRNALDIELYSAAFEFFSQDFCAVWPKYDRLCGSKTKSNSST